MYKRSHFCVFKGVKWQGQISEKFRVDQGVRQGGILSADLYKVYGDSLLDRLSMARNATRIGPVICMAPTCADDRAVGAEVLQSLLDIGIDNSKMERYILQPVKSLSLEILNKLRRCSRESNTTWDLDGVQMPKVEKNMVRMDLTQKHPYICTRSMFYRFYCMEWKLYFLVLNI